MREGGTIYVPLKDLLLNFASVQRIVLNLTMAVATDTLSGAPKNVVSQKGFRSTEQNKR